MATHTNKIFKEALDLPALDRVNLADRLLRSLDRQDEAIDELWKKEIGDRLEAYRAGNAETVSMNEVLAKYTVK
jgi:putative addiction module component (TIGR02574 family)